MVNSDQPVRVLSPIGEFLSNCTIKRKNQLLKRNAAFEVNYYTIQLSMTKTDKQILRKEVLKRDNYVCYICNTQLSLKNSTIDHVLSRAKGGSDSADNLACCCKECNSDKGDMDIEDYLVFRKIKQSWQKVNNRT